MNVELGLDQKLAIAQDSYLHKYFEAIEQYLEIGPPLYFVFKSKASQSLDMRSIIGQTNICGKFLDCNERSIGRLL